MRKVKEVLRLRFGLGLQQNQIARSCSIGQATVHRYLQKAAAAGLSWPLPDDLDDRRLDELLFRSVVGRPRQVTRALPDFAEIRRQLQTHKHLTLQLLWEEYRQAQGDGYGYSRFCELYERWGRNQDVVLRQEHRAGEKMFVDWAGDTIPIYDRHSAEITPASLFVAVLGASTYTYARATLSQDLGNWVDCHVAALEYFQGAPKLVIPDNPRTGVDRACRYEPDLNRTYQEMAAHYSVAVMPARPRKPRDKAKVENAVLVAERWIVAALRHRRFYSLAALHEAIAELLEKLNQRPFRKRAGCRASLFAEVDRPALQALPSERYVLAHWKTVRASIDYHVEVDRHYYSVPYQLAGEKLEARFTTATVEILYRGKRVASHARSHAAYRHTTVAEHMPKSHQAHLEWTPSRLIHWAEGIGLATAQVVRTILERKPHPEMGYRACLGILRLEKAYSKARLEAASERAVHLQTFSYQSLKSILKHSLDRQLLLESEATPPGPQHENLRGPHYYDPPNPLVQ
ncbi:MAG TPA: IS21 family transposase [Bryobacteraceae bacterium]|nr:IS21 family transposase [Bryobacteraceae bacterium]